MKDTIIKVLVTTGVEHNIRIRGTHDASTLALYRDTVEDTDNLEDAVYALTDEGATVVGHEKDKAMEFANEFLGASEVDTKSQKHQTATNTVTIF